MSSSDDRRYVTRTSLQEMLDAQTKEMKAFFDKKMDERLKPISDEIAELKKELHLKNAVIDNLKSEVASIKASNEELVKFQNSSLESFKLLEEKLEDRTNRQLRQTVVIKGLPEKDGEKWTDTRNALAKHISKAYKIEFKKAYALFDRVHRGGGDGFEKRKKGKRDIYALCSSWDNSEFLVWNSFKANKTLPKKDRVFIEYKYGSLTSLRRGQALKLRKELIEKKEFKNAYVKFPAILMARKDGEVNYSIVKDFSDECVSKLPLLAGE